MSRLDVCSAGPHICFVQAMKTSWPIMCASRRSLMAWGAWGILVGTVWVLVCGHSTMTLLRQYSVSWVRPTPQVAGWSHCIIWSSVEYVRTCTHVCRACVGLWVCAAGAVTQISCQGSHAQPLPDETKIIAKLNVQKLGHSDQCMSASISRRSLCKQKHAWVHSCAYR